MNEHSYRRKNENYIPLGINARGITRETECCLNEVSCPSYLTWYHTQSHYPDIGSTSPSSTPECQAMSWASIIFNDFGVSWPRIEPVTSHSLQQSLYWLSYRSQLGNFSTVYQLVGMSLPFQSFLFQLLAELENGQSSLKIKTITQ